MSRTELGAHYNIYPLPSLCKGGCRAERGGRVVKVGVARARQPFRLLFSIACHGLGGARSDAASGHGFCPQWQKPQFAARAHHTVVMRITRGSPPCTGEAREEEGFPLGGSSAEGGDEGDGKGTVALLDPSSVTS